MTISWTCCSERGWIIIGVLTRKVTILVKSYLTPVYLVQLVGNCVLCMRRYLACSSYTQVMHCVLIMHTLCYDASIMHYI